VALSGTYAIQERLLVGAKIDKVNICVGVLVVEPGGTDDISVFLLEGATGDNDTLGTVLEVLESLVTQKDEPVPAVGVVERDTGSHLVNVGFWVKLDCASVVHRVMVRGAALGTNLIALDVVEGIAVCEQLGNSAFSAAGRASDDEDVVAGWNGHGRGVGRGQMRRRRCRHGGRGFRWRRGQRGIAQGRGQWLFNGVQHGDGTR
jgi:hypothetical protein